MVAVTRMLTSGLIDSMEKSVTSVRRGVLSREEACSRVRNAEEDLTQSEGQRREIGWCYKVRGIEDGREM